MSKEQRRGNKETKKPKAAQIGPKGPKAGPKYMGAAADAGPFLKGPAARPGKPR